MNIFRKLLGWNTSQVIRSVPSYERYREIQNSGNIRKIQQVFVREENIERLSHYIRERLDDDPPPRILCHGTRNGAELRYFKKYFPEAKLLGTDIADSASQFADTIQWDFHDLKNEWVSAWDVIYSNSWDHAFDPSTAFKNWMSCLKPKGFLFLEHTTKHMPSCASQLDPFGSELAPLIDMLNKIGQPDKKVVDVISDLPQNELDQKILVVASSNYQ